MKSVAKQPQNLRMHYQCKTTPSYTLVPGHPAGMENLNPTL